MLLLIFVLWFAYAVTMTGVIVATWAIRVAFWLIAAAWRLGRWGWKRHEQRRRRDARRP